MIELKSLDGFTIANCKVILESGEREPSVTLAIVNQGYILNESAYVPPSSVLLTGLSAIQTLHQLCEDAIDHYLQLSADLEEAKPELPEVLL